MNASEYRPGLDGVVAGETAISAVEPSLHYRGYDIRELARYATVEETAFLLLHGDLPTRMARDAFQTEIAIAAGAMDAGLQRSVAGVSDVASRAASDADSMTKPIEMIAHPDLLSAVMQHRCREVPFMDWLRTAVGLLSHDDPDRHRFDRAANLRKATRLLVQIPMVLAELYRRFAGFPPVAYDPTRGLAENVLRKLLGSEPEPLAIRALEVTMIAYADHEWNASTFTARVVASTGSDLHSAVTAAIAALKGPLHGGANEHVIDVLRAVESPDRADAFVREALTAKRRISGFGHRSCKAGDVRAELLKPICEQLATQVDQEQFEQTADAIERAMLAERGLRPNVDWPVARIYHYLGLPTRLNPSLFAISRTAGWCAHVMEQQQNNRLISPRARYVGPALRAFVSVERRSTSGSCVT